MNYQSETGARNYFDGELAQQKVADFFQEKLGEPAINKSKCGHDVVCGEHNIDVKSISSLFRSCKPKNYPKEKKQMNAFMIKRKYLKEDTTLFSFVISDDPLIPEPKILTVEAETVFKFIEQSKSIKKVVIPLWWVKANYNYRLSKLM